MLARGDSSAIVGPAEKGGTRDMMGLMLEVPEVDVVLLRDTLVSSVSREADIEGCELLVASDVSKA